MIKHAVSRLRRMTTIIGSLAVAVFLMAAMPYVGKSHPTGTAKAIPKITEKIPPPPFESTINTLGITKYASAYAGERITRSGHLIIYIVRPKAGAFLAAVRHASVTPHSGPSSYTLVPVEHSWAQLNAVTIRIFSGLKELRANGIK